MFTLGLMLHEIMTGEVPFGGKTVDEAVLEIGRGERPSVVGLDGEGVVGVMVRMWDGDAEQRPRLREVVEELERYGGLCGLRGE